MDDSFSDERAEPLGAYAPGSALIGYAPLDAAI
jgi:hypothetical protein